MKTKEQKDREAYEWVLNAKTPEERIKRVIKNFKKDDKICSAILYLAPEVVDEGRSTIMIDTIDDDFGTLMGQLQMDMMTNVQFRNFLMEVVDGYREIRCSDDIIEDVFYSCDKLDIWNGLSEEADKARLGLMRVIADNKYTKEVTKRKVLRSYIERNFGDGKEVEA